MKNTDNSDNNKNNDDDKINNHNNNNEEYWNGMYFLASPLSCNLRAAGQL